jgi:hypothetical protein
MYAVVVNLTITDPEAAEKALYEQLVPRVSQAPGLVAGYWTIKEDSALSMFVLETEEAANRLRELARAGVPDGVRLEEIEVREVVAHA